MYLPPWALPPSHLFWAFLFGSTCEIIDVPLLPPLPLPEGHGAHDNAIANNNAIPFLVRQYFIVGVHNFPKELRSHVIVYHEELITLMEGASESWWLITKEKIRQYWPCWSVSVAESLWSCLGQFTHKYISGVKNMPSLPAVTVLLSWHALTMPTVMPGLWECWHGDSEEAHVFWGSIFWNLEGTWPRACKGAHVICSS